MVANEELESEKRVCSWKEKVCVKGESSSDTPEKSLECPEAAELGEYAASFSFLVSIRYTLCSTINFGKTDGRMVARRLCIAKGLDGSASL